MRTTLWNRVLLILIGCVLAASGVTAAPAATTPEIRVLAFNVLAPSWAYPGLYPVAAAPYLDRALRRGHIIDFMRSRAANTDIFALQETTTVEFGYFKAAMPDYVAFQAYHSPTYWSNWITADPPWEPNGVAIFVKATSFRKGGTFADVPLTDDGNHAAIFSGVHVASGKAVRAMSVHLDSDSATNRNREFNAALGYLPVKAGTVDVVAGDFNTDTDTGNFRTDLYNAGFVDVLHALGISDYTSPWSESYYGHGQWGIIDHVIARRATPRSGKVFNFGLFTRYPNDQDARIVANLQLSGSDHFPVEGVVAP